MNSVPTFLYKYLPPERASSVLGKLLIRFSQVSVMNDIEEFKPPIKGVAEKTALQQIIVESCDARFPGLGNLVRNAGPEYMAKLCEDVEGKLEQTKAKIYGMNDKNFGILSLSEESADIRMWENYAGGGHGFLLEFGSSHKWFWQTISEDDDLRHLRRITYVDDRTPKYLFATSAQDYLYTKETKWKHEKEWRIILNFNSAACKAGKDNTGTDILLFAIPPDCLVSVTVGYNATAAFIEQVNTAISANAALRHLYLRRAKRLTNDSIEIEPFA